MQSANGGAKRLLVMDDEPEIGEFIREVAEDCGYEVAVATDSAGMARMCEQFEPDFVVLDLAMPGTDGIELLRYLADVRTRARIVVTSGVDPRVLATASRLGSARGLHIAAALPKPFSVAQLRTLLHDIRHAA